MFNTDTNGIFRRIPTGIYCCNYHRGCNLWSNAPKGGTFMVTTALPYRSQNQIEVGNDFKKNAILLTMAIERTSMSNRHL